MNKTNAIHLECRNRLTLISESWLRSVMDNARARIREDCKVTVVKFTTFCVRSHGPGKVLMRKQHGVHSTTEAVVVYQGIISSGFELLDNIPIEL